MLRRIPREPRRISTAELQNALVAEGLEVTVRTIQRDLEKLSAVFPLRSEQESRSNHWFWTERGNGFEVPGMSPATALTFLLARDYLASLFPPATLGLLQPYFDRAQAGLESTQFHDWNKRVRAISRGPTLLPAKIDPNVQAVVYGALLEQRRFAVDYKSREDRRRKRMEVNPLGLVVRGGVSYLVCTLWGYDDVRHLALHRMSSAELLDAPAKTPAGFDLERYIEEEGGFSYPLSSKPIKLRVLFNKGAAAHLYETPLTPKQRLTERKDGRVLLEAEVLDTSELR